jgi:hypothetical protein
VVVAIKNLRGKKKLIRGLFSLATVKGIPLDMAARSVTTLVLIKETSGLRLSARPQNKGLNGAHQSPPAEHVVYSRLQID